jgi:tRNA U34 2-thiouridine synthase MnmA/TrmU
MQMIGADFIITGEVLGQRPMSQRKNTFPVIDKASQLKGYILRPLSAKLLDITVPEEKRLVNRNGLYDFSGRTRKPQIALAKEFGLTDYPAPAGGCLLTEPNYSHRLKELLDHTGNPEFRDINLLRTGRHFRFSRDCKIIVGRNKQENETLLSLITPGDCMLRVEGFGSPITIIDGDISNEALAVAASLCARYSDAKHLSEVDVTATSGDNRLHVRTHPAGDEMIELYRIEKKSAVKAVGV